MILGLPFTGEAEDLPFCAAGADDPTTTGGGCDPVAINGDEVGFLFAPAAEAYDVTEEADGAGAGIWFC